MTGEQPNKTYTARKDRPTHSIHFGDTDFPDGELQDEDYGDATWAEVCNACCVHTRREWAWVFVGLCAVVFFLYFFLFGLELLGTGAKVMSGCKAGELFGDETNPVAGLMVGILATVLLQSSSTTTSIIVSLTGTAISVQQGIYMGTLSARRFLLYRLMSCGYSNSNRLLDRRLTSPFSCFFLLCQSWEPTSVQASPTRLLPSDRCKFLFVSWSSSSAIYGSLSHRPPFLNSTGETATSSNAPLRVPRSTIASTLWLSLFCFPLKCLRDT